MAGWRIAPVLASIGGPFIVTGGLLWLVGDAYRPDPEHLVFIYLVPTSLMAMIYGSASSILASTLSALCAMFFLYPPRYSFFVEQPNDIVELVLFLLLAFLQSKFIGGLADDKAVEIRRQDRASSSSTRK